jgi:excisionase family DNA binding protein
MIIPNPNDRLMRYLLATRQQQAAIDQFLEGTHDLMVHQPVKGPLLLGMGAAAKYLGVSRATLWRMIQAGKIAKVELFPGSFRVRRADIEAICRPVPPQGQSQDKTETNVAIDTASA